MKICQLSHVEHSYSFLAPLFSALSEEGHEVVAACNMEFGGDQLRHYLGDGYPFHQIRVGRRVTGQAITTDVLRLARYLKQEQYDVVHVHYPLVSLQGRLAAAIAQVPAVVYHAHGFYFHEGTRPLRRAALIALERTFGRHLTDYLITVNTEDFDFARRRLFRPSPEDIVLTPGVGIDTDAFRPLQMEPDGVVQRKQLRSAVGVQEDDVVVTFVGRLVAEKGVLELAEAFSRLVERQPAAWLWLVGDVQESERDQSLLRRLDDLLRGHPAAERVLRLGRRHDISQVLHASDLFVLPSYREGMPVALLEAMSCGLPVVATDVRGCREAVGNGLAGKLVPPRDADALTHALRSLIGDQDERRRLGEVARSFVVSRFSVAHSLEPQIELYRRIEASLGHRRPGAAAEGRTVVKQRFPAHDEIASPELSMPSSEVREPS